MEELEEYARTLEASGDYRVLRRLTQRKSIEVRDEVVTRRGLFVDVETTGLDPSKHEIIELDMVPFSYGLDGTIYSLDEPFRKMRQPLRAIPAEITAITGIHDSMVAGAKIDPQEVAAFAAGSVLIIAHDAEFDRRFFEGFSDFFAAVAWACSMTQIDWIGEGYQGFKLSYLANDAGFFYERHRAISDCFAAIELLARPLARSGRLALTELLERAGRPPWRVWADSAPFDTKDLLKSLSYPSPNMTMRWCTDRLKIEPTSGYIKQRVSKSGAAIVVLGVRRDESQSRLRSIDKFQNVNGGQLTPHERLPGALIYRPIVDMAVDEIWEVLGAFHAPWGGDYTSLIKLYRDSEGGESRIDSS